MKSFLNRRNLLKYLGAMATVFTAKAKEQQVVTPSQTEGPFYPRHFKQDVDSDLSLFADSPQHALGDVLKIKGQVLTTEGQPLSGVLIEIWQCDYNGVYHYTQELGAQADPFFQGYGRVMTDEDGRYAFQTIKPVPYIGRTPHIHFKLSSNETELLTTQMYSADEHERNAKDGLYRRLSDAEQKAVTVAYVEEASVIDNKKAFQGVFDIVVG